MGKKLLAKSKDKATSLDLASFFAGRAGFVIPYLGILVWSAWIFLTVSYGGGRPQWLTAFVVGVIWMTVPLGLRLADQIQAGPTTHAAGLLRVLVLPTAAITTISFLAEPGFASGVLTVPWLMLCGWAAAVGVIRFLSRSSVTLDSITRDISLIALAAGAALLTLARVGLTPLNLSERRMMFVAACGMSLVWLLPLVADRLARSKSVWFPVVVHLARRTPEDLRSLRSRVAHMRPTVDPGLVNRDLPPGYRWDEWSVPVANFENSCEALWNWAGHRESGTILYPERPRIAVGETFVSGIPFGPLSITIACRITKIINEPDVYGFVYSTLGHHALSGEQSLILTNINGNPMVSATAIWSPTIVGSKMIPRLTLSLMGRHIRAILDKTAEAEVAELHSRMHDAVESVVPPKTYRPASAAVVEKVEAVVEQPKPKTGSDLLAEYEESNA